MSLGARNGHMMIFWAIESEQKQYEQLSCRDMKRKGLVFQKTW